MNTEAYIPQSYSLEKMPREISDAIYRSLPREDLLNLTLVSKAIYITVQSALYRNVKLGSYPQLQAFVRTMDEAARVDNPGEVYHKNVQQLDITVDPNVWDTDKIPTSMMVGKYCERIARYCQGIQITLRVVRARCADSPIRNFAEAEYPNVATLILNMRHPMHMTRRDTARATSRALRLGTPYGFPSSTTQLQTGTWLANRGCSPNTTFWRAILNGRSFPDLKRIEIYHAPGAEISEVERRRRSRQYSVTLPTPDETAAESYHSKDSSSSGHGLPTRFVVGELDSLKTLEELILSLVPELNDSILLETTKFATALTTLDIRNCPLSMLGLHQFLPIALPRLQHFTLHIPHTTHFHRAREEVSRTAPSYYNPEAGPRHLCVLFREFGKHLDYLEFHAPWVCQELFVNPEEIMIMEESGWADCITGAGGFHGEGNLLPTEYHQLAEILGVHRDQKVAWEQRTRMEDLRDDRGVMDYNTFQQMQAADKAERERKKVRRIVNTIGMCRHKEIWEIMCRLAALEDEGMVCYLGHERLLRAGCYRKGDFHPTNLDFDVVFAGKDDNSVPVSQAPSAV